MLNRFSQPVWKYGVVFLLLLTVPFGFILLNKANADNLLANGSFISDLSGWSSAGDLRNLWDPQGDSTPILNMGVSYPGTGGAVTFTTSNSLEIYDVPSL